VNATDGQNRSHTPAVISMKEVAGGPDLVLTEAWSVSFTKSGRESPST
jgi:hypothetical protein